MTSYQETDAVPGSTEEVIKVRYTAKAHTLGGRRGGDEGYSIMVPSRYVPMLSHPKEVRDLIEQAAAKAGSR
jgi:hypothetical protein